MNSKYLAETNIVDEEIWGRKTFRRGISGSDLLRRLKEDKLGLCGQKRGRVNTVTGKKILRRQSSEKMENIMELIYETLSLPTWKNINIIIITYQAIFRYNSTVVKPECLYAEETIARK